MSTNTTLMLTSVTSDFHPSLELNIKNYRENLAIQLESICLGMYTLERIPNFIGLLTEHQIYLNLVIFIIFQPNKDFVVDDLPATVYESDHYDYSKLKESWRLLVRYHQSQEVEIFDSGKNTTTCHFQFWVAITDKACLLKINLRNDLKTFVK